MIDRVLPLRSISGLVFVCVLATLQVDARAAEIHVASSGGFAPAYKALAPTFEKDTGDKLTSIWGPSMGETVNAIPKRLERGEPIDVVIMVGGALDDLIRSGQVSADSKTVLARSRIAMAVRAGAPRPDIHDVPNLRRALLAAKSIAYSDSASGVYLERVLFPRLGIADELRGKARMIPAEPVGLVVARGDAEIGFQQLSELKATPGIDIVGFLPDAAQEVTVYSAGVTTGAREPEQARRLLRYLASPEAAPIINATGLDAATLQP